MLHLHVNYRLKLFLFALADIYLDFANKPKTVHSMIAI